MIWRAHPALLYALTFFLGCTSLLFSFFWSLYLFYEKKFHLLPILIAAIFYSAAMTPENPTAQKGYFTISQLKNLSTSFQKGFLYRGFLYLDHQKIPCSVFAAKHYPANSDYLLTGELKTQNGSHFRFMAKKWKAVPKTFSLAEFRYELKERFRHFLSQKLSPKPLQFLSALITGDVEDRTLRFEFGRLGLQHILAISGFHFAALLLFCSLFLDLFLPKTLKLIVLLLGINVYFFFLGSSPSVQRSYLAALFYLISKLIRKDTNGLNLLGVAMLAELFIDPHAAHQIGFQLSYLSTGGILLIAPLLPKWPQLIKLTLSVNLAIFPLLLYHFHQFPLLSLIYNLFFPFLVSLSLFLLLFALLVPPLFPLLDFFTTQLLDLASYPPIRFTYTITMPDFSGWWVAAYLAALLCLLHLRWRKKLIGSY